MKTCLQKQKWLELNKGKIMHTHVLNIGLAVEGKKNHKPAHGLNALKLAGLNVISHNVLQSDSEPTLVANVHHEGNINPHALGVSNALDQDCIGVYNTKTKKGELIGSRAKKWGEFNPDYFFLHNGKRLSDVQKKADGGSVYQGHLPDGSSVQKHSAGDFYPYIVKVIDNDKIGRRYEVGL